MQNSQLPLKWYRPFAVDDAAKVEIPVTTADPTRASQSAGFPPLTMQPPESGGVPPQGEDFNGAMNQVARVAWWMLAGGALPFDAAWAADANIGGYPQGAVVTSADLQGEWISTADNNTNNPDTNGASWVPGYAYGAAVVGTTGVNLSTTVTLTPAQAAKSIIFIQGNLTAATTVVFPPWAKNWLIVNNTGTGAFTLTAKTAAGSGVVVNRYDVAPILCDTTNILAAQRAASANIARYTANGSFTVPSGVTTIYVSGCGGGGGGGGCQTVGSPNIVSGGGGGGAASFAIREARTVTPGQVLAVTIGAAGAGGTAGSPGVTGGTTSLGAIVTLGSGTGGGAGTGGAYTNYIAGGVGGGGAPDGSYGQDTGPVGVGASGGAGGSGPFGGGGGSTRGQVTGNAMLAGKPAQGGYGGGGGGAGGIYAAGNTTIATSTGAAGGDGGPGFLLIEW